MTRPIFVDIGEAMIEFYGTISTRLNSAFASDAINTAVYLARTKPSLDVTVVATLGNGNINRGISRAWQAVRVEIDQVLHLSMTVA